MKANRPISKSGGSRQRIWTALCKASRPLTVNDIATIAEADKITAWGYLTGLKAHGYVNNDDEAWVLKKNTGPRSPSINVNTGTFHDWNLAKTMTGKELERIWKASELSLNQFGVAVGLGPFNGDRIKHMISGQRPVSPKVEAGALVLKKKTK